MSDRPPRQQILDDGATRRELAIADTDGRLDDIDTDLIRRVKSVDEAPADFLPYLAWERSVDVWRSSWPEDVKRRVIKAAPIVHRYKGTRFAVVTAVGALGVKATFTEWWEASPRAAPYTFEVVALANERAAGGGPLITPELTLDIRAAIMAAKPLSRAFDLKVGVSYSSRLGVAGVAQGLQATTTAARASPPTQPAIGAGVAALAAGLQVFVPSASAAPPTTPAASCSVAAVLRGVTILNLRMEARPPL